MMFRFKILNGKKMEKYTYMSRGSTYTHSQRALGFFLIPANNKFLSKKKPANNNQPVREAVSYRGLFTAGWFGVREKHCSPLEIYDRLRASEQAQSSKPNVQPWPSSPYL